MLAFFETLSFLDGDLVLFGWTLDGTCLHRRAGIVGRGFAGRNDRSFARRVLVVPIVDYVDGPKSVYTFPMRTCRNSYLLGRRLEFGRTLWRCRCGSTTGFGYIWDLDGGFPSRW